MIRVVTRESIMRRGHDVWILDDEEGMPLRLYKPARASNEFNAWVEVDRYATTGTDDLSFWLPEGALEALVGSTVDVVRSRDVLTAALDDTRSTRDKLLVLVEHVVLSK